MRWPGGLPGADIPLLRHRFLGQRVAFFLFLLLHRSQIRFLPLQRLLREPLRRFLGPLGPSKVVISLQTSFKNQFSVDFACLGSQFGSCIPRLSA